MSVVYSHVFRIVFKTELTVVVTLDAIIFL